MALKLGILDQSPMGEQETGADALRHTAELARKAEELGYSRYWVSEHHDLTGMAGSSPEVLISYLLAQTSRIRIGSGGVMLQHYSPYKIAENFNVLSALAPGRVDLGIGSAAGGLPLAVRALRQESVAEPRPLADKLRELAAFLRGRPAQGDPLAVPLPPAPAELIVLGTSPGSAELAASLGAPYVFAQFINSSEEAIAASLRAYREAFQSDRAARPLPILAVSAIVADTDEEAEALAADVQIVRIRLESGRAITVRTVESAEAYGRQSAEPYRIEVERAQTIHGSKETVRRKLLELQAQYGTEEFVVTFALKSFQQRLRAYTLLREAFTELTV